ncbi:MAG: TonB-dependent receptor [Bacteroidetes bacterium]|nr:TonB-dependent receptor [Flavobacteriales bacterium]NOG94217.1 TonB-dependent receptor [Bacteroidota bacterium]WKZ76533.1 MAG: TonB-dependent receptor [Vicingaceae bacterium]
MYQSLFIFENSDKKLEKELINIKFVCCLILLLFIFSHSELKAQTVQDSVKVDSIDIYEMSLEQLLKLKAFTPSSELEELINSLIISASQKPMSYRESPNIVSLITAEEIKKSGARDLIDVLRMLPGFEFGMDVEGVVGIGIRGNWAHEGKILLLIDGQEMNENLFGTTQFGNHYPINNIKRIEAIRGPGSAVNGGYAEYGVINIITFGGEDIQGIAANGVIGQMLDATGRKNISLAAGNKWKDFDISLFANVSEAIRSDADYTDVFGNTYNMANHSNIKSSSYNLGITYKGLQIRSIANLYQLKVQDGYDAIVTRPYWQTFSGFYNEIKYVWKINNQLTITPKINIKNQTPWKTIEDDSLTGNYHKEIARYRGNLSASWNLSRKINIVAGVEHYIDEAKDKTDSSYFINGKNTFSFNNTSYFIQGLAKHRIVNLILGARYDMHSTFGEAFVPRVGLTKKINRINFKVLYSNSFRAPSVENINLSIASVKPEYTQVIEAEIGTQLTRKLFFTANIYDIITLNPIVYYYDEFTLSDRYTNFGKAGTRGVELEIRMKNTYNSFWLNYSFYTVKGKDNISDNMMEENSKMLLAFPAHQVNLTESYNITRKFSINTTMQLRSVRYGYTATDTSGNLILSQFKPILLFNLYFLYQHLFTENLDFGVGVYNLLNEKNPFIQPYYGMHAPLPGASREVIVRVSYHFKRKTKTENLE